VDEKMLAVCVFIGLRKSKTKYRN